MPNSYGRKKSISPDMKEMSKGIPFTNWTHPATLQAFKIVNVLQTWVDLEYRAECRPLVALAINRDGLALVVGDVTVWDSESCEIAELTFDACREKMREYALLLYSPFE